MSFKEQRLEDLCELVIDCPHSTPKWTDKGFIVLRNQNIRNGVLDLSAPSFTDEDGYKSRIKRAKPRVNDIVFTREAPMGEVCLIPEGIDCCLGQRQVLLRANSEIDPYYLFWALQSPYVQHQISWNEGTGTTVSNVRIPVLKDLKIPRLGEHESWIAKTMTSLALKSQINEKINQTLEQMAQALFKSWFVDFEPVKTKMAVLEEGGSQEDATLAAMTAISGKDADALAVFEREHPEQYAELKATAELFPSAMQESELGEIPEGWRTENVENIINRLKVKNTFPADCIKQFGQHPVLEQGAKIYQGYHDEEPSFNASLQSPMFIFGDHTCVMHLSTVPFDISKNTLVLKGKGFNTYWTFFALKGKQKFQEYKRHWSDLKVKQVVIPDENNGLLLRKVRTS
ncbi:restriction endonuclease subunit S, partial [Enterobacter sp. SST3]|uniref:restriction endonuclease subunit S n=1 Tax=Enterobacter sp. SST3 TaxID=1216470 RepID=UPI00178C234C